jgi:hypothetical protein
MLGFEAKSDTCTSELPSVRSAAERRPSRRRRRRVQLDLLADVYDRVVDIQHRTGIDSVRSVFREAFRLYEWYVVRRSQGWTVQLVHEDGRVAVVDLGLEGERSMSGSSVSAVHLKERSRSRNAVED